MRICFISHSTGRHGAEKALLELLEGLLKLNVTCLVILPKEGPLIVQLDRLNIEWKIMGYPKWRMTGYPRWLSRQRMTAYRFIRTIIGLLRSVQLARTISKWDCDLVYTNTSSIGIGGLAAWLIHKPHIWHLHESGRHMGLKYDFGERRTVCLINYFSSLIIVVSHSLRNTYSQYIKADRMRMVYQSITIKNKTKKHDLNYDKEIFQCIIVASLHPYKGQDEAIAALSELILRKLKVNLLIVGDGWSSFQEKLRQQITKFGLNKYVKFIGYIENPMPYFQIADAVLVCSHWESFGRVTVEAMLAGKPVIGTASGGTAELIQNGITGLLYNSGNHIELANKIQYLYENPKEKLKLGTAARTWAVGRFTQERYTKEIFNILCEVLDKKDLPK
tara:strand:+ start:19861 stop:21030 length:1170 start_codon:yes stop_codon:yes gene_type:complete